MRGNRIEDRFECASDAEHTYDWAFHAPGRLTTSLDLKPGPERIAATAGYQHVEGVASGRAAGDWWARWEAADAGSRCT